MKAYPRMLDHATKPSIRVETPEDEALKVEEGYYYYDPNHAETDEQKLARIELAISTHQAKIEELDRERKFIMDNKQNMLSDTKHASDKKAGRPKRSVSVED